MIDGISVYETRLRMGESLADKIKREYSHLDIDVVIPIPDSSRPSAMQLAEAADLPYREGFIKNRYIGRTFIMPGQAMRREIGAPEAERDRHGVQGQERAAGRRFDRARHHQPRDRADGARGGRAQGVLRLGRAAGALPNVYGIDMPTRDELIATGRTDDEIAREIGCRRADLPGPGRADRRRAQRQSASDEHFEASCFSGIYITGDITQEYLAGVEAQRNDGELSRREANVTQLDLNLATCRIDRLITAPAAGD